ncbi:NDUBB-like protein [Mya arenaria]|uniref:NADH dehydrogenase [ubiquinone] 1 beta subcomplex subunit 11, mitochondrial n=1 Tax=Mya arenaria TaxID=6604 RepID=A0ABY7G196_MYAAR|nr:NADH dehydrogenase [ubiquinone] 1 beta subcomplex subunit 11, mitochondrial-like [Mya arenaria]WAR27159.1 NDUBB-like protein [Mya arenaria]
MATLQTFFRQGIRLLPQTGRCRCQIFASRPISTSDRSKELGVVTGNEPMIDKADELKRLEEHFADADPTKLKNWQSYGWSDYDREADSFHQACSMLGLITIGLVPGIFLMMYSPDFRLRDWATREAYLDIERREKQGLPAIDPYCVSPETVQLPSEEEIGNTEIII